MSRRNSREEKARRRLENAWKENRYTPAPIPDEYISHIGFIPDEPFWYNSCLAATQIGGSDFAFRTKNQLVDFVEKIEYPMKKINTKSGKRFVEVSVYFHTDSDCVENTNITTEEAKALGWGKSANLVGAKCGGTMNIEKAKTGNVTSLYLVRHRIIDGEWVKDRKDHERMNPNYASLNTLWVPLEEVKNLPEGLFTDDERVHFSKFNEAIQPMDEEELDRMFNAGSESVLHEYYETNEDGEIIIDEFFNDEGKSIGFQPRKTRETWLRMFHPFPIQYKRGKLMIGAAPETDIILTKQTNDYS